jgi:hypothetical protein
MKWFEKKLSFTLVVSYFKLDYHVKAIGRCLLFKELHSALSNCAQLTLFCEIFDFFFEIAEEQTSQQGQFEFRNRDLVNLRFDLFN